MSAHELEPQKEQRRGFTGKDLVKERVRVGAVYYRHKSDFKSFLIGRFVVKDGPSWGFDARQHRWMMVFGVDYCPIGRRWLSHITHASELTLRTVYTDTPSQEYMVLDGLGLPDELLYEVYQYCE